MSNKAFDVVVIGGGPGGYIAAIRAAQLGFNTACIDDWKNAKGGPALGGTCTNVGCIPSKALLQSSEHFEHAGASLRRPRHRRGRPELDVEKMLARKDTVVKQNNDGILYLFKKNKVSVLPRPRLVREGRRRRLRDRGRRRSRETLTGQARHRRHRLEPARAAGRGVRRGPHPVQRRRAAHRRRAEDARA